MIYIDDRCHRQGQFKTFFNYSSWVNYPFSNEVLQALLGHVVNHSSGLSPQLRWKLWPPSQHKLQNNKSADNLFCKSKFWALQKYTVTSRVRNCNRAPTLTWISASTKQVRRRTWANIVPTTRINNKFGLLKSWCNT